jgi:hypothetical protein
MTTTTTTTTTAMTTSDATIGGSARFPTTKEEGGHDIYHCAIQLDYVLVMLVGLMRGLSRALINFRKWFHVQGLVTKLPHERHQSLERCVPERYLKNQ